jgi:PAS domain S-box-containing protein
MKPRKNALPFRTALTYALFGILWILISDLVVEQGIPGASLSHFFAQTTKGLLFVLASSALIYFLLNAYVSRYKAEEEKLKRSESSLADAQEISNLGSWELDVETRQGYWSRKMFQMFGFEQADSPPDFDAYLDRIHPEDRPAVLDALEKMTRGEPPVAREFRSNPERLPLRYLQPTWRVIRDQNGKPVKFQGTVLDITERKTNEQRIRYLTRLYATLSQVNQTIVRVKTREELFDSICKVAVEFGEFRLAWVGWMDHETGRVAQTAMRYSAQSRLPFQEINVREAPFKGGLIGKAAASGLVEVSNDIQTDPAMAHWHDTALQNNYHSAAAIPIRQGGRIVAMLNLYAADIGFFEIEEEKKLLEEMGLDISFALENFQREADRIQAENALRQSEERFYKAFHSSPVGMYISRAADNVCIDINEAFCALTGYNRQELLGHTSLELGVVSPEQNQEYTSLMRGEGVIRNHEMDIRKKSGEIRAVLGSMEMIELDGQTCVLSTAIDITDRRQAQRELKEARDRLEERVRTRTEELHAANLALEKASKQKDEFLAGMSHELRTPLNAVINLSESLKEGVYGALPGRQEKIVDLIGESGRHLLELINDVLDLSKIEAGKLELQYETVSLKNICEAALRMIREDALKKELQISTSIEGALETIQADQRRLRQMLVNLLSNAVKFTSKGGSVGLEVVREHEDAVRFTVWDTGIGIPDDQLRLLFTPFTQLDSALSKKYNGTGLGLALVRQLAEMHNGSVGVESEPGRGSRFYFIIPARGGQSGQAPKVREAAEPPSAPAIVSHAAVLLVEDNPVNRMVTNDYLAAKGYNVVTANDGFEAIEQAETRKPDLIIMDIQMPGIDGLETIRRLRAAPEFASVPIIALTALAMPGDRERCLEAGADEYLAKPASPRSLIVLMERLLARSRPN